MMMKRWDYKIIPFLLILLAASFFLIGCPSTGVGIEHEDEDLISFDTGNKLTKGVVTGNTLEDNFGVYGYYSRSFFLDNGEYDMYGDPVSMRYYWPALSDSPRVSFIAYSPFIIGASKESEYVVIPVNTQSLTRDDVMYAKTIVNGKMRRVPLSFNHALSWIQFAGKYDTLSIDSVEVTSIQFGSKLYTRGNLKINANTLDAIWTNISSPLVVEFAQINNTLSDTTFVPLSNTLIIPQAAPTSVVITLNALMNNSDGQSIYYNGRTITKDITDIISSFDEGSKYVFKYVISADGVDFTVDTDNWDNPGINEWESWDHTDNGYVDRCFCRNLQPDGKKFMYVANGLDFSNGDYIEAKMDLSQLNRIKQNIFSVGDDIKMWSTGNDGAYNFHAYFPNANGDRRLRFSAVVGERVNGLSRRTMGVVNFPIEDETSVVIRFDKNGFYLNGRLVTANDFEIVDDRPGGTYPDYLMSHFNNGPMNIQFGSLEGSTRSYATYDYIMYHHNF